MNIRVLVVDDEPSIRFVYQEFLEDRGVSVTLAGDGKAAIEAASAGPHSAALVDLNLPDISGLQVIRALREAQPGIPVIVISATPRENCQAELDALRVDSFLEKPVDLLELADVLARLAA